MKIGIANDHRGYKLKKEIIKYFNDTGYNYIDYGAESEDNTDYVDYAVKLCNAVNNKEVELGVLICGTGIGMSIAANKIKGIRCARVCTEEEAKLAKEHNMANVIALGEKTLGVEAIVSTFINTEPSKEERHIRRLNKINALEE